VKRTLSLVSLSLVLSCWLAAGASAGTLTVNFDFSGSSVEMLGGLVNIPPQGSIQSASGAIDVSALGSATAVAGPGVFRNFQMALTINASVLGNVITGNAAILQLTAGVPGLLNGGLNLLVPSAVMQIQQNGTIGCTGPSCAILSLPTTINGTQALSIAALPIANLNSIGNAAVNGSFDITFAGFTGVLHLVGTEVSRSWVVPEPNSFALIGMGLVMLAASRARSLSKRP
jgi:hypothetical protein